MKDSFDSRVMSYLSRHELLNWMSDETFIKIRYWIVKHKRLNLNNPKSFNEKIQWLKLYYRKKNYIMMVDKYEVKSYVGSIIGQEHIVKNLGGPWDKYDDIEWDSLPDTFVLKCTHNSGNGVAVVKDKSALDKISIKKQFDSCMRSNFFYAEREWPYKYVKPRIIAEEYLCDEKSGQLMDYKVHVFCGEAKIIQVDFDRYNGHKRNLYDREWNYIPAMIEYPTHPEIVIERPQCLSELIRLSENLSCDMPYVRVDFYIVNDNIYFGELTFYHGGGLEYFDPESLNIQMGEWIILPEKSTDEE